VAESGDELARGGNRYGDEGGDFAGLIADGLCVAAPELAEPIEAPARHRSVVEQGARVIGSGGDVGRRASQREIGQGGDFAPFVALSGCRARSGLSERAAAPTPDAAGRRDGARVAQACRDARGHRSQRHVRQGVEIARRPSARLGVALTEFAVGSVAPAADAAVLSERARVVAARFDLGDGSADVQGLEGEQFALFVADGGTRTCCSLFGIIGASAADGAVGQQHAGVRLAECDLGLGKTGRRPHQDQ
jgi:hypothetical protein